MHVRIGALAMAHVISFITSRFDIAAEKPNPINPIAGQSVLLWLKAELLRADYQVTEPDTEDWGWYMDVQDADAVYLVGASADAEGPLAPLEWTVQVHKHRSMTDRLLGRNKMAADDRLSALIERLIRADGAMQQISVPREA
jgi:hypothetical protein